MTRDFVLERIEEESAEGLSNLHLRFGSIKWLTRLCSNFVAVHEHLCRERSDSFPQIDICRGFSTEAGHDPTNVASTDG